jgi:hypothetical protein
MNINVELTDKQVRYLKLFAKNQYPGADDNLCTHQPIHVVQTQKERVTESGYEDEVVYLVPDWDYRVFYSVEDLVKEYYYDEECPIPIVNFKDAYSKDFFIGIDGEENVITSDEDYLYAYGIPNDLYEKRAVELYYEDVAYFFTLQSAKEYIKYQGHNLNNPRTYTKSGGYDNRGEYHHFWELLMSIGIKLNKEGE